MPNLGKKYGHLDKVGKNKYKSKQGLVYGPDRGKSKFRSRKEHVEAHYRDDPTKKSHGVFAVPEKSDIFKIIDEGWEKVKKGAKGVTKDKQGGVTVYEVDLDRPIGFVGGSEGASKGFPFANRLRIVTQPKEGSTNVISAYPVE